MSAILSPSLQDFYKAVKGLPATQCLSISGAEIYSAEGQEEGSCCDLYGSTPTALERENNQRAWRAFERAVKTTFSADQIDRYYRRYHLNIERSIEHGLPLQVHHIERIAVGASRIFVRDLMVFDESREYSFTREQVDKLVSDMQEHAVVCGLVADAAATQSESSASISCYDMFYFDHFKKDKKRCVFSRDLQHLFTRRTNLPWDFPYIERIGKMFVSLELEVGEIIPTPSPRRDGSREFYQVRKKIGTGDGLVAYAFVPLTRDSNLTPIIFFRPTQMSLAAEDAIESIMDDLRPAIGETGYMSARELLNSTLRDLGSCRVVGYSLGSTQAQRFIGDVEARNWEYIREAHLFCGPSMDRDRAIAFSNMINASPRPVDGTPQMAINIYRNRTVPDASGKVTGDIVDYAGEVHLGFGITNPLVKVTLFEFQVPPVGIIPGHNFLAGQFEDTAMRVFTQEELDVQLDNLQRGEEVAWYERTRVRWGSQLLYHVLYGIYRFLNGLLCYLGIRLFRSSRNEPVI